MYRRPHLPTPKATPAEMQALQRNASRALARAQWLGQITKEGANAAYARLASREMPASDRDKAARCYAAIERSYRS